MKIYNDYCNKKYTKIKVPIILKKTHSDYGCNENYFDVDCDSFCQEKCYIKNLFVEKIFIQQNATIKSETTMAEMKWNVEIVIPEYKDENEVILIVNNFCREISLNYALAHKYFQYGGFKGFAFREMDIKRYYSDDNSNYGDAEINTHCGMIEIKTSNKIKENIFELPKSSLMCDSFFNDLSTAFINALKADDDISRFLLLYYLFELIFESSDYKEIEITNGKRSKNINLLQYLTHIGVEEYYSLGKTLNLSEEILLDIIKTRNNLTHRGDTTKISSVMYQHLLPILQQLLIVLENNNS